MKARSSMLLLGVLAAGCGGAHSGPPRSIAGPAKEAAQVVERLGAATARKDFATICDELLSAATRQQAGGAQCESVLAARADGVRRPRIVIQAIAVEGAQAAVRVRTTAIGQAPTTDTIRLAREQGKFRIVSLGR